MRINKYLAECGICSRRKADELIQNGSVFVNKKPLTQLGYDVDLDHDVVYVFNKKVTLPTHYDYVLFYKPKGCICTATEEKQLTEYNSDITRKTIFDYIKTDRRLFSIGRLDYDSEGLLLLTNDGNLGHALSHPSFEIPKTYIVKIEGEISESDLGIVRKGVKFKDVQYASCKIKVLDYDEKFSRLEVKITEGKNREIRNMFEAVEKNVVFLKRIAIGDLKLGGLSRGGYRNLNPNEVEYLRKLCQIF